MSDVTHDVPEGEGGILRIFSVDTEATEGVELRDALREEADTRGQLAARALGIHEVDPWWVTLVGTRDLREIGLAGYLSEGYAIERGQIDAADMALGRAGETLLFVQSPAFGGHAVTLEPADWLTPVAEFDTTGSPAPARSMAPAETTPVDRAPPPKPAPPGKSRTLKPTVILAILAAAALVVALVGLGGN